MIEYNTYIRDNLPTQKQIELLQYVQRYGPVTSSAVADSLDISLQSATQRLKLLYSKGYLNRYNVGSPSGGTLYKYEYFDND